MELNPFDPKISCYATGLYRDFTEHRNCCREVHVILTRKFEGAVVYPVIAVIAVIEMVARIVFTPLSFLPMLFQTKIERHAFFDSHVRLYAWGVPMNLCASVLAIGSFATNLFVNEVDPQKLNSALLFWMP